LTSTRQTALLNHHGSRKNSWLNTLLEELFVFLLSSSVKNPIDNLMSEKKGCTMPYEKTFHRFFDSLLAMSNNTAEEVCSLRSPTTSSFGSAIDLLPC
jgi:hypothetical protein